MSTPLLTTPNRVFLKPPFEGVTGHPQNTLTIGSESLKGVLCKYLHSINSQVYVIVRFMNLFLTIPTFFFFSFTSKGFFCYLFPYFYRRLLTFFKLVGGIGGRGGIKMASASTLSLRGHVQIIFGNFFVIMTLRGWGCGVSCFCCNYADYIARVILLIARVILLQS